jgi:hypothetical protein
MLERGRTLFIAYDESNHGRFPEICVAVFSLNSKDFEKYSNPTSKKHSGADDFSGKLITKDYSLLLLNQIDKERIKENELLGRILGSLTIQKLNFFDGSFSFLIDGEWAKSKLDYTKDFISEINSIEKEKISIQCGKDFDKLYPLVNFADEIAYWHYKNSTPEKLSTNVHLVSLLESA